MKKTKKVLSYFCAVIIGFLVGACSVSDGVTQSDYDELLSQYEQLKIQQPDNAENAELQKQQEEGVPVSDKEATENDIEIISEYSLQDSLNWYTRHFMVIKNNTDKTLDISTSSLAYDVDGNLLGVADATFDALGAGCISVIYEPFDVVGSINNYETTLNFKASSLYESVIQDLSYSKTDIQNGAVFQVINNGKEPAQFVEGYALFFSEGKLVSFENTYFTDDDSEIKSGVTISKQFNSTENFDSIEFYLTGRR